VFHRLTKGNDSNISVEDLEDLVHQVTYCLSHAGVRETATRCEFATRLKGQLHNYYPPEGIKDQLLAAISEAGPKLLNTQFVNSSEATCSAPVGGAECEHEEHERHETTMTPGGEGSSTASDSAPSDAAQSSPVCGGEVVPMSVAVHRVDDDIWLQQAEHEEQFRQAVKEWEDLEESTKQEPFDVDHEARQLN
jgi:hypothetical protein